jgi:hypothetical protein
VIAVRIVQRRLAGMGPPPLAGAAALLVALGVVLTAGGSRAYGVTTDAAQIVSPSQGSLPGNPLTNGGSGTPFSLTLPASAACSGDTPHGGYRVQSYIVPAAVDPATLTFGSAGPVPTGTGTNLRQALYLTTTSAYVNVATGNGSTPGPGPVANIGTFSFGVLRAGDIPPGSYNVGLACTRGGASATQLDRVWNTSVTISASSTDRPGGFTWTALGHPAAAASAPAAPAGPATAPTATVATTASPVASPSADQRQSAPEAGAPPSLTPRALEVLSGLSPRGGLSLVVWMLLVLVLARIAVLVARSPRVLPEPTP